MRFPHRRLCNQSKEAVSEHGLGRPFRARRHRQTFSGSRGVGRGVIGASRREYLGHENPKAETNYQKRLLRISEPKTILRRSCSRKIGEPAFPRLRSNHYEFFQRELLHVHEKSSIVAHEGEPVYLRILVASLRARHLGQRVAPPQAPESRKVGIRGTDLRSVFDSNGSQVSVGCKVSAGTQRREQFAQNCQVARTGMHDSHGGLIQPRSQQIEGCTRRQRAPEQARPGGQPEECEQHVPGKSDGFLSRQNRFEPEFSPRV